MRAVTRNGTNCPPLTMTEDCSTAECSSSCVYSEFVEDGTCSAVCGGGTQKYKRSVSCSQCGNPPDLSKCDLATKVGSCNTMPCSVDCMMGDWGAWSTCTAQCGLGQQSRRRSVVTLGSGLGKACGSSAETRECAVAPCPQQCNFGEWLGACSAPCGGGQANQTRSIVVTDSRIVEFWNSYSVTQFALLDRAIPVPCSNTFVSVANTSYLNGAADTAVIPQGGTEAVPAGSGQSAIKWIGAIRATGDVGSGCAVSYFGFSRLFPKFY